MPQSAAVLDPMAEAMVQLDLDRLQGTWVSFAGRRPVELFIAGHHFTARFLHGDLYMGSFELHPDEYPARMIMHIDEGPPKHKDKSAHCIYALESDCLRWCPTEPGAGETLFSFPDVADARHLCTVFRRESPKTA